MRVKSAQNLMKSVNYNKRRISVAPMMDWIEK